MEKISECPEATWSDVAIMTIDDDSDDEDREDSEEDLMLRNEVHWSASLEDKVGQRFNLSSQKSLVRNSYQNTFPYPSKFPFQQVISRHSLRQEWQTTCDVWQVCYAGLNFPSIDAWTSPSLEVTLRTTIRSFYYFEERKMRPASQFLLILFALSSPNQLEESQVKRRFEQHTTRSGVQGRV